MTAPAENGTTASAQPKHPLLWVPTSYFAMGTVYVTVTTASTIMFRNLGMSTAEAAFWSSWMGFAYTVKFLWAPLLEMFKTKKFFVVTCQFALAALLLGVAFLLPLPGKTWVVPVVSLLFLSGFIGATMDIATDGVYVTTLPPKRQAQFTGVQSMSWSIGPVVATGLVIYIVGVLHESMSYRMAWLITLAGMAAMIAAVAINHLTFLPAGERAKDAPASFGDAMSTFGKAWASFIRKPAILWMIAFAFLYRWGLGLLDKMGPLFLIDSRVAGGIGLDNTWLGLINGTFGTVAFIVASILGGLYVARGGLRRVLLVLVLCLNLPNVTFLYMGLAQPDNTTSSGFWLITALVTLEKFGWGFGAVGHMLYMMQQIAPGPYKTAHYAFATALMGFCMMVTGILSSYIQPATGYEAFFIIVLVCAAPSLLVTLTAPFIHSEDDAEVGKDEELTGPIEKKYVLPRGQRLATIGAVLLLAVVGGGVAYARAAAFTADRNALSADRPACFERNDKRACYFQCDHKKERAACLHLAQLFAADARDQRDSAKYAYERRETWKWYEADLKLRCGDSDTATTDHAACAELGAILVDPEFWEDAVSRDTDIAAGYVQRACAGSNAATRSTPDAAPSAGATASLPVPTTDLLANACSLQDCIGGDAAKCTSLCDAGYAGGCRQLASLRERERKADEAAQLLRKALELRCDREQAADATACHKLAELVPAEATRYLQRACELGVKPDCTAN